MWDIIGPTNSLRFNDNDLKTHDSSVLAKIHLIMTLYETCAQLIFGIRFGRGLGSLLCPKRIMKGRVNPKIPAPGPHIIRWLHRAGGDLNYSATLTDHYIAFNTQINTVVFQKATPSTAN
jgi:hypothetical protein